MSESGKPLTIAYLTSMYARPSDTFIRNEVRQLRAMGHTVHTFSIRSPPSEGASVGGEVAEERTNTTDILDHRPGMFIAAFACFFSSPKRFIEAKLLVFRIAPGGLKAMIRHMVYLFEACYLARELKRRQVDWLHNHIAENSATVAMLAGLLADVPFSMTVHGPGIFYRPTLWALDEKIHRCGFAAVITRFCRSQCMVFTGPRDWRKLKIVHCSVQPSFLDADPPPLPDKPNFVCVGRLCAEKGHGILIEAAAKLRANGVEFHLTLVGDGEMRSEIEAAIGKHQLESHVTITGWLDSEGVRQQLTGARALVMASFAEGLPVVCMEALASGRPVIATRIAGIPELIEPGDNGWLVTPSDVDELVAAMSEAVALPIERLRAMGAAGRARIERDHHPATETAKLAQHMREALR